MTSRSTTGTESSPRWTRTRFSKRWLTRPAGICSTCCTGRIDWFSVGSVEGRGRRFEAFACHIRYRAAWRRTRSSDGHPWCYDLGEYAHPTFVTARVAPNVNHLPPSAETRRAFRSVREAHDHVCHGHLSSAQFQGRVAFAPDERFAAPLELERVNRVG